MANGNKYKENAEHYLENAYKFLHKNRFSKASEFLWGSASQSVKAVALDRGVELPTHAEIWNFVDKLAGQLKDQSIRIRFSLANSLHQNFYEHDMPGETVKANAKEVKILVRQLLKLANHTKNGKHNSHAH